MSTISDVTDESTPLVDNTNNDLYLDYLKSSEGKDTHNIAAMLHLIQFMISQLHEIQDSITHEKSKAVEYWTKEAEKASDAMQTSGMLKLIDMAGPLLEMAAPFYANDTNFPNYSDDEIKALLSKIKNMGGTAFKSISTMGSQVYDSKSQESSQHSQLHQSDKESLQTLLQNLSQALQAIQDRLNQAINTLGTQNKDSSGR
ncbi:hypothetical protein COB21_03555 [Candidatus Aerophobetes bacterium]|uniref:Uncharacterized protein n=1 Tax=Aerophobetes bacterium TaxID=2030807 RepID=A0A2A4X4F9_UNCAE|nr:MAG: hypothetical protein COB21_03555 [Candidatus Aerophobetes bacterium]